MQRKTEDLSPMHSPEKKKKIDSSTSKKTKQRPTSEQSDVLDSSNEKNRPTNTESDIDSEFHSTAEDNSNVEVNDNIKSVPDNATVQGNKIPLSDENDKNEKNKVLLK